MVITYLLQFIIVNNVIFSYVDVILSTIKLCVCISVLYASTNFVLEIRWNHNSVSILFHLMIILELSCY